MTKVQAFTFRCEERAGRRNIQEDNSNPEPFRPLVNQINQSLLRDPKLKPVKSSKSPLKITKPQSPKFTYYNKKG